MHYYQKNIADFNNATRHLTRLERSIYSDAIELYFDTEKPLTKDFDRLSRLLLVYSDEEKAALRDVINEFFILTDEGYENKRCNEEIQSFQAKSNKAKESINARWNKEKKPTINQPNNERNTNVIRTNNERNTNHKPITNNHKPLTIIKTTPTRANALDDGFYEFWNAYPKKVGKELARKSWIKEKPNIDHVLKTLQWQIDSDQWNKSDGQFIPNPATYINQHRYDDERPAERVAF